MNNLKTISEVLNPDVKIQLSVAELFVKESFGISKDLLYSKTRKHEVSHSRFIAFYILNRLFGWSLNTIGRKFGKDHSSVLHGIEFVEKNGYGESIKTEVKNLLIHKKHLLNNSNKFFS